MSYPHTDPNQSVYAKDLFSVKDHVSPPPSDKEGAEDLGGSDNRWWNGSWEIYGFGPIQKWSESVYRRSEG
jgi:hypothetical protein